MMHPARPILLAAFLLAAWVSGAAAEYDDAPLNRVLAKYVKDGRVNYEALSADTKDLDAYVGGLRKVSLEEYNNWSTASKKAFWINAYNALCLKQALENYPCEAQTVFRFVFFPHHSPQSVSAFFTKKKFRILDDMFSLDLIQKLVLRIRLHDAKTLFAVCPAAQGGPKLRSSVYEGPRLKEQLEQQIKAVISDKNNFAMDKPGHAVSVSQFFEWYGEDFIPLEDRTFDKPTPKEKERAVMEFLMDYVSKEDAEFLKDPTVKVHYAKYDWTLNE